MQNVDWLQVGRVVNLVAFVAVTSVFTYLFIRARRKHEPTFLRFLWLLCLINVTSWFAVRLVAPGLFDTEIRGLWGLSLYFHFGITLVVNAISELVTDRRSDKLVLEMERDEHAIEHH